MSSIIRYNSLTGWMPGACRLAILCSANPVNLQNGDEETSRELHYDNHFTVTGNITKTVVATGAELVGYSGFSASNYISKAVDGDWVGVDFIPAKNRETDKPFFIEVNSNPGLTGIEETFSKKFSMTEKILKMFYDRDNWNGR